MGSKYHYRLFGAYTPDKEGNREPDAGSLAKLHLIGQEHAGIATVTDHIAHQGR